MKASAPRVNKPQLVCMSPLVNKVVPARTGRQFACMRHGFRLSRIAPTDVVPVYTPQVISRPFASHTRFDVSAHSLYIAMPSTVIRSFSYDDAARELRIVFQSGRPYVYQEVPKT